MPDQEGQSLPAGVGYVECHLAQAATDPPGGSQLSSLQLILNFCSAVAGAASIGNRKVASPSGLVPSKRSFFGLDLQFRRLARVRRTRDLSCDRLLEDGERRIVGDETFVRLTLYR